jgi:hypothetical protein
MRISLSCKLDIRELGAEASKLQVKRVCWTYTISFQCLARFLPFLFPLEMVGVAPSSYPKYTCPWIAKCVYKVESSRGEGGFLGH